MKQCDMGQNVHMPNGRNAISNKGQQATGKLYNTDHVRTSQTETQGFQFIPFCVRAEDGFVWKESNHSADKHVNDFKVYQNNLYLETHSKSITRIIGYMGL